jgi:hypothetical protein
MRIVITGALFLFVGSVLGQNQKPAPSGPALPDIARTVQAIQGTWLGSMTANVPGYPAETFDWRMDCKVVALGAGASCTNSGKASIGSMAESCLVAFDPDGKAVHYMCVTSMGEVHDHKGFWKDHQTIEFEPLRAGMMGQTITEILTWRFPDAQTIDKVSEVKLADGNLMRFEFKGRRGSIGG